jgi:DNA-binding transcriptional MerR regulator
MDLFSISQLSRYSGIKPHTIRIWEKRYNALKPVRSEGNTRYYDNSQLRRLLNIVSLADTDHKISELCGMPDKKLFGLINQTIEESISSTGRHEYFISQLIAAGMSYDEQHFDKIFGSCVVRYGLRETYTKVIYPMLVRIGLMWSGDSVPPANEHFMSNLVKQKIIAAIDSLPPFKPSANKWLLFLKENELHELGLLFASWVIRLSGAQVIYLGADVPFVSLAEAIKATKPRYLLFFLVHYDEPAIIQDYCKQLAASFTGDRIFVSGDSRLLGQLPTGKKMQWLKTVDELEHELTISNT